MPAKVFISCGQGSEEERDVARQLGQWFASAGYRPYVAIEIQSILDLNAGIIGELKTSDYYLFINFRREKVITNEKKEFWRGSVYTNQELAIAYALGFDHMLLLNQKNSLPEGVFKFIISNIPEFENHSEVLPLVQMAVRKAGWQAEYTRQLNAANLRLAEPVNYHDHTGGRVIRVLQVDIQNNRSDVGAVGCVARLSRIGLQGQLLGPSPDKSLIKVTGQPQYDQTIWPGSHGAFDLCGIEFPTANQAFLNSSLDTVPRAPILGLGFYHLEYEVFCQGFPPLKVNVHLTLTGDFNSTFATLI